MNVTPLVKNAVPGSLMATTSAPRAGPAKYEICPTTLSAALAAARSSSPTRAGVAATQAGR
jgi:hypothetical protein